MGFDCTLHVIDEGSFERFAARFLRGEPTGGPAEIDALIARTREVIAEDPDRGARALGELALRFASTEAPHRRCRGFALSLWDEEEMGAPLPARLIGSVEPKLEAILRAHPQLVGRVPTLFEQNACVGAFVEAKQVPALLAHVDAVLEGMVPGRRRGYQPLREVLRVAVERGHAYWEGTDLDVSQAHEAWLETTPSAGVTIAPSPFKSGSPTPRAVGGARWLVFESWRLHDLDLTTFPPEVITREGVQVICAAFTPWGTTLARMADDRSVRPYRFADVELPERTPIALPFELAVAFPTADAVLLAPVQVPSGGAVRDLVPRVMRPSGLTPLALPPADPETRTYGLLFARSFGDGSTLIIWDGKPYHWSGEGAPVALEGGPLGRPDDLLAAVTLSDGSIVGGFERRLLRIDRQGRREIILPLDNVMAVGLGPDDALIISEGDHPEADLLKIWWPATRELTLIGGEVLGLGERAAFSYYDAPRAQLVLAAPGAWHAIAWAELAALPRIGEAAYVAARAALVARMKPG